MSSGGVDRVDVPSEVERDSDEVAVEDHVETLEDRTPITRITVAEHYRVELLQRESQHRTSKEMER